MREGDIAPGKKLFSIAHEIEHSAIELNIGRLVETDDEEFNGIARRIDAESREHRNAFDKAARLKAPDVSLKTP
jgi:hypothetical protein